MPDGRILAIGDIHGCGLAFTTLLGQLQPTADDTLVVLGDVIDRGFDSSDIVRELLELNKRCHLVPILGNHEQMLLDAMDGKIALQEWLFHGGAETLDSYGTDAALTEIPSKHVDFIRTWGDCYEMDTHFFAHGNYAPDVPLAEQPWETMRWRSLRDFLPGPHCSGKTAVLGHTANKQGHIVHHPHLVCIDTYCHGGGWLTAFEPATGKLWQTNKRGRFRTSELAAH